MGSKFPRMRNFELLDTKNNSVVLQMEIDYDGDCSIDMEVTTSVGGIPIGIKDVKLKELS